MFPAGLPGSADSLGEYVRANQQLANLGFRRLILNQDITRSTRARCRTISAYIHGIGSNLPGQSVRLCGHASHVASCGSHSAGMR